MLLAQTPSELKTGVVSLVFRAPRKEQRELSIFSHICLLRTVCGPAHSAGIGHEHRCRRTGCFRCSKKCLTVRATTKAITATHRHWSPTHSPLRLSCAASRPTRLLHCCHPGTAVATRRVALLSRHTETSPTNPHQRTSTHSKKRLRRSVAATALMPMGQFPFPCGGCSWKTRHLPALKL